MREVIAYRCLSLGQSNDGFYDRVAQRNPRKVVRSHLPVRGPFYWASVLFPLSARPSLHVVCHISQSLQCPYVKDPQYGRL